MIGGFSQLRWRKAMVITQVSLTKLIYSLLRYILGKYWENKAFRICIWKTSQLKRETFAIKEKNKQKNDPDMTKY